MIYFDLSVAEEPQVGFKRKAVTTYCAGLYMVSNASIWYALELCIIAFAEVRRQM